MGTGPHVSENERAPLSFHLSDRIDSPRQGHRIIRRNLTEGSDTLGGVAYMRRPTVFSTPFPTS